MEVDRNTQVLHALPEREIHVRVEIVPVGLAVDERALEPKPGAVELSRRFRRRNIPKLPLLPTGPQINLLKYNRTIQMTRESAKS
jgi:hypothetical protein